MSHLTRLKIQQRYNMNTTRTYTNKIKVKSPPPAIASADLGINTKKTYFEYLNWKLSGLNS